MTHTPPEPARYGGQADADEPHRHSADGLKSPGEVTSSRGHALPEGYGEDKVVAMPRSPDSLFVYWDLTGPESAEIRRRLGDASRWVLRASDTTTGRRCDTLVDPHAGNHYLRLDPGGRYVVRLGVMAGRIFHPVCRSAECGLPADEPRSGVPAQWADSRTGSGCSAAPGRSPVSTSVPGLAYDPAFRSTFSSSSYVPHNASKS